MRSWRSSVIGYRPIGLTSNYLPKWRRSCTVSTATVVMLEESWTGVDRPWSYYFQVVFCAFCLFGWVMEIFVGEVTNCFIGRSFVIGYRSIQASVHVERRLGHASWDSCAIGLTGNPYIKLSPKRLRGCPWSASLPWNFNARVKHTKLYTYVSVPSTSLFQDHHGYIDIFVAVFWPLCLLGSTMSSFADRGVRYW